MPKIDKAESAALKTGHLPLKSQKPKINSYKLKAVSKNCAGKIFFMKTGKNPIQSLGFKNEKIAA